VQIRDTSPDTLLRVAQWTPLFGAVWAGIVVCCMYLGARFLPPAIPRGAVWTQWRRKRVLWGLVLLLGLFTGWLLADRLTVRVAAGSLYWFARLEGILWIGRLGAATGFAGALGGTVLAAWWAGRRARRPPPPQASPARRPRCVPARGPEEEENG